MNWDHLRVLITGGASFIGSARLKGARACRREKAEVPAD
jgi:nucleoside-diphosphate-sugar epimerase